MQVMLMRLMSKGEYVIVPKGTKFTGSGKLGLIVFQLCGCFQEFLVGVEKVAFSHPQGSIIGFLSIPLQPYLRPRFFPIFLVLTGSLTCIGPILFVPSLIDSIVFEINVGQVWMLAISGVYLSK